MKNEMTLAFDSLSENEGFARVAVAAFVTRLNPTLELERSGMGFMFMEAFMDQVEVQSSPGVGTTVYMKKRIKQDAAGQED